MGPHAGGRIAHAGAPLDRSSSAMIMVHGRNAAPENILDLLPRLNRPAFACLAPAAAGGTWYSFSFMADRARNEPGLSSGLAVIESLVASLLEKGMPSHRIALLGFSQGACLAAEHALRHPRHYGGVIVFSGGVIGPPGTTWDDLSGSLDGTPVFLGCSDIDAHVPAARVLESETVFARLGAEVTRRLYPGMGHLVNDDEIAIAQEILDRVLASVA